VKWVESVLPGLKEAPVDLIEYLSGDIKIVKVSGRLDAYSAGDVEKKLDALIADGNNKIVLNLEALEYISSSGLRVFLAELKKIRKVEGDIKLSCMKPYIKEVFDIAGFTQLFSIHEVEDSAVKGFNPNK
jgi:anti-sigma B factor antagonist